MLAHVEALAHGDRVRRDLALMVLPVVVARHDRGHQCRDRGQVRLVELAVKTNGSHRRGADAREDADELALLVGEHVRFVPGDEENADGLVGRAKRVNEQRLVAEALEELSGWLRAVRAA